MDGTLYGMGQKYGWVIRSFDQLRLLKTILGLNMFTSTVMCYGECGRFPMALSIFCKVIKYLANLNVKHGNCIAVKQTFL